jgi:Flp pilus assembly protein TadG
MMMTFRRRLRSREQGQSLVEFALVFLVFMTLFIAIFDVGRAVFAYNSVTNAAREGVRFASVNQDTALITQRAISQVAIAETAAPNVSVTFRRPTPNADYSTNAVCSPLAIDCVAVVTFQTTFRPITPLISNILFPSGVTFTARSAQSIEFVCPNALIASSANCPKQP